MKKKLKKTYSIFRKKDIDVPGYDFNNYKSHETLEEIADGFESEEAALQFIEKEINKARYEMNKRFDLSAFYIIPEYTVEYVNN